MRPWGVVKWRCEDVNQGTMLGRLVPTSEGTQVALECCAGRRSRSGGDPSETERIWESRSVAIKAQSPTLCEVEQSDVGASSERSTPRRAQNPRVRARKREWFQL